MRSITLGRFNSILVCAVLISIVLYYGRVVLIPLAFAGFFAMLTKHLASRLEKRGMSRVLSSLTSLLIVMITSAFIIWLVFMQFKELTADMSKIKERSSAIIGSVENYLGEKLSLTTEQTGVLKQQIKEGFESSGAYFATFFSGFLSFLRDVFLVLAFMFLFLYQREKYENFIIMLVKEEDREEAEVVLNKITKVAQQYLTGRMISVTIFTVLFTAGFLIVGIKGAFLLAFMAALLTIIPYVGSIVGGIFPFAVTLVTSDSSSAAFGALVVIIIIQFFDNYFIEPYVIGGAVHISGFFSILILLAGGLLWGPAGMILFLPMLGVAKIIFDNIPALQPYGYLVGDQEKKEQGAQLVGWFRKIFKK